MLLLLLLFAVCCALVVCYLTKVMGKGILTNHVKMICTPYFLPCRASVELISVVAERIRGAQLVSRMSMEKDKEVVSGGCRIQKRQERIGSLGSGMSTNLNLERHLEFGTRMTLLGRREGKGTEQRRAKARKGVVVSLVA